jgi:hypothetical protein
MKGALGEFTSEPIPAIVGSSPAQGMPALFFAVLSGIDRGIDKSREVLPNV